MKIKNISKIRQNLVGWYLNHNRKLPWRDTTDPYRIWVSEVMLQQTQVKTVIPYYLKFLKTFPKIKHLAQAKSQSVLKVWEGLGYYARARNLHRASRVVLEKYQGNVPNNRSLFLALPGVGKYISAAVLSIAFNQPYAVVDGNVKRFLSRLLLIDHAVNTSGAHEVFEKYAQILLDQKGPGRFNEAMMELGALVCQPRKPLCVICPLMLFCLAYKTDQVEKFPKRVKKKPIPRFRVAFGIIFKHNRILITRRKEEGLLGGLWEFPGGKVEQKETSQEACIREIKEETNLNVTIDSFLIQIKHAYTHFKIIGDVFICKYSSGRVRLKQTSDFRWVTTKRLDDFPFPGANRKFIPLIKAIQGLKE